MARPVNLKNLNTLTREHYNTPIPFSNMKMKRLTILILAGIICCACSDHREEPSGAGAAAEIGDLPDQESWESTIIITREGRRMAEVWAGYIAVYNKSSQTVLKDSVHVDFFNREGQPTSVLTSRQGVYYQLTRNLTAGGNVVVVSNDGVILETEELMWDNQKQKVISDVTVKFTTATDTLIGDSFISDPDLSNYEIRNARGYSRRVVPVEK